jgi:hypothetical protein
MNAGESNMEPMQNDGNILSRSKFFLQKGEKDGNLKTFYC